MEAFEELDFGLVPAFLTDLDMVREKSLGERSDEARLDLDPQERPEDAPPEEERRENPHEERGVDRVLVHRLEGHGDHGQPLEKRSQREDRHRHANATPEYPEQRPRRALGQPSTDLPIAVARARVATGSCTPTGVDFSRARTDP